MFCTNEEKAAYKAGLHKGRQLQRDEDYRIVHNLEKIVALLERQEAEDKLLAQSVEKDRPYDPEEPKGPPYDHTNDPYYDHADNSYTMDPVKVPNRELLADRMVEKHLKKIQRWLSLPETGLMTTQTHYAIDQSLWRLMAQRIGDKK